MGWIVYAPFRSSLQHFQNSCLFVNLEKDSSLHHLVEVYFNIANMGVRSCPLIEGEDDIRAKKILIETTKRIGKRFETGLLWKNDDVKLPNSPLNDWKAWKEKCLEMKTL